MPLLVGGAATPLRALPEATLRLFFGLWDTDATGTLDQRELAELLRALHIAPGVATERELEAVLRAAEEGRLDFAAFLRALQHHSLLADSPVSLSTHAAGPIAFE